MTKRELPPNVYRTKGVIYFAKRPPGGGSPTWIKMETQFPEGAPVPFALHQERERLLAQPVPVKPGQDVAAVIRNYRAHRKFAMLAQRTRADYVAHLEFLTDKIGAIEPKHIERRHVISWLDTWGRKSAHRANYRLRVLRLLLEHAIDMGLLPTGGNPAKGVAQLAYDRRQRTAWPVDMVQAFRAASDGPTRLLFEMLIHLGQRIGDTRQMRWPDYDGTAFRIRQGKTGAKLYLPVPPVLKDMLDAAQREALFIFPNRARTGPIPYQTAQRQIMRVRREIGAEAYDIHALRHTRASELAAAGHDDATIMSITGHKSVAALRIYTEEARQMARAKKASRGEAG